MGFKSPAKIHFDTIILSDEAAMKNLMVQLVDRDLISQETLLERFGELPEIEKIRIKREEQSREKDPSVPSKASPFHNPQHKEDMAKLALQNTTLDSETYFENIGLPFNKDNMIDNPPPAPKPSAPGLPQKAAPKKVTNPQGGRPLLKKDTTKRATKRVLPKSGEAAALWALSAQRTIANYLNPIAMQHFDKKNMRSLTKAELDQLEYLKLCVLSGLEPFKNITEETIKSVLDKRLKPSKAFLELIEESKDDFISTQKRKPTVDDLKYIYATSYAQLC